MAIAWFDAKEQERKYLDNTDLDITFFDMPLSQDTVSYANGFDAVSVFISSHVDAAVLAKLEATVIACRSTGYDHIDTAAAEREGITVCHVPQYGANTVAEHTFGLLLALTRKIYYAINRVKDGTFDRTGLRGIDLHGKTLGVIGTGDIGTEVIRIANGFHLDVIAYTEHPDEEKARDLRFRYVSFQELLRQADIISIHCPLTDETYHMLSDDEFAQMDGTILINTARGAIIDTEALLKALNAGNVSMAGLDVLEEECHLTEDIAYLEEMDRDCDLQLILEDHLLMQRDDVLITPHNAFNSEEALQRIVDTTVDNIRHQYYRVI